MQVSTGFKDLGYADADIDGLREALKSTGSYHCWGER